MKLNHKNFSIILLSVIFAYLAVVAAINVVVDPFYIFRTPFFKAQAQINDRYAKIEFLKKTPRRFNSYILGSSRMFFTHPDTIEKYTAGGKFYNFATIAGTMYEHLLHVKYFVRRGYPLKNLYIGLDPDMYFILKGHDEKDLLFKLHPDVVDKNLLDFYWCYLSTLPKGDLRRKLSVNFKKKASPKYEIEKDGALAAGEETRGRAVFFENPIRMDKLKLNDEGLKGNLEALRELVALCGKDHIRLVLFITPYYKKVMDNFLEEDYLFFLRKLSEITGFWDFSGYNSVTTDRKNYLDNSHYSPTVSRFIAARIFENMPLNVPKDFGVWVTDKNIEAHLEDVKKSFRIRERRNKN